MRQTLSRSRRWPWLLGAVGLLAVAAWLMSRGERMPPQQEVQVHFPRHQTRADFERLRQRQVPILAPAVQQEEAVAEVPAAPPKRGDPLLLAMPSQVKKAAIVVEANALRHSPIGELLLDCFMGGRERDDLTKLRSKTGLDVLEDLDRVAVADQTILVSGRFENVNWPQIIPSTMKEQASGSSSRLWTDQGDHESILLWKNQIMAVGRSSEDIQAASDRLEGRVATGDPVIAEQDRFGDIYGTLSSAAVAELFEQQSPDVATKLKAVTDQVRLHVDATNDVGIVADTKGNDPMAALDLAKTLGGALALGRAAARAQGRDDLAAFLDYASVRPDNSGSFRVELALPLEFLKSQLKDCPGRQARGIL